MTDLKTLRERIEQQFSSGIESIVVARGELTLEVKPESLKEICITLRDAPEFRFNLLVDVCGIDYLHYGLDDWQTTSTTETGFSRGVTEKLLRAPRDGANDAPPRGDRPATRFAVVYHLLSLPLNHRVRLRVNLPDDAQVIVDSVMDIWPAANWFEREAFDLFGILFRGHPDLRRILTDYGFVGHPFRKDFPLIGKVEVRYDAKLGRVVYEPVSIEPRVLEPKVIRHDNRYLEGK
jgi:NADH-quinone oxidoreductase subunit C